MENLFEQIYSKNHLAFNFGGFYHSIHDNIVDSLVEQQADYLELKENTQEYDNFYGAIDFNKTFQNYIDSMLEAIDKKFGCNLKECFVERVKPSCYNSSTDYILLDKSKANNDLKKLFSQEQELKDYFDDIYNFSELEFEIEFE